jgi:hypothetical protein
MNAITYKTKAGTRQYRPRVTHDEAYDGTLGFCLACGVEADGVEPDARRYTCDACGAAKVYGLEELALMGLLDIDGGEDGTDADW